MNLSEKINGFENYWLLVKNGFQDWYVLSSKVSTTLNQHFMKTLLTVALASALSFSSFIANASEDLKALSTVNSNYKKISVTLNEGVGKAKISILTPEGKSLSSRKVNVKNEMVMLPYDMNNMPAGEYLVKIVTDEEEVTYTVETNEKPIPFEALPLAAYGKVIDGNTVNLTVLGIQEPGIDVKIYAVDSGEILYKDHIDQAEGFKRDYSFKNMNASEVYMKVFDKQGRSKTLFF